MRLRIAIVDDEELARAVVREYLTGMPDVEGAIGQLCTPEECEKFAERT